MFDEIEEVYFEYEAVANEDDAAKSYEECFGDPAYYGISDFDEDR